MKKNFPHISFCSVYKFCRQSFCIIIFDFIFVPFLFHNHVFLTILNSQHLENLPTNLTIFSFFLSLPLSFSNSQTYSPTPTLTSLPKIRSNRSKNENPIHVHGTHHRTNRRSWFDRGSRWLSRATITPPPPPPSPPLGSQVVPSRPQLRVPRLLSADHR